MRGLRDQAIDKMSELSDVISAERMLDYLVTNHLSGVEALAAMKSVEQEFLLNDEEDDEDWDVTLLDGLEDEE